MAAGLFDRAMNRTELSRPWTPILQNAKFAASKNELQHHEFFPPDLGENSTCSAPRYVKKLRKLGMSAEEARLYSDSRFPPTAAEKEYEAELRPTDSGNST
jgi:hypothetical protein